MSIAKNNRDEAFKNNTDEASQVKDLQKSMSSIKHKFLVMSSKGGVGKTSVIVNLALAPSMRGMKVGLMDLNYNSPEIHKLFGFEFEAAGEIDNLNVIEPSHLLDFLIQLVHTPHVIRTQLLIRVSRCRFGNALPLRPSR